MAEENRSKLGRRRFMVCGLAGAAVASQPLLARPAGADGTGLTGADQPSAIGSVVGGAAAGAPALTVRFEAGQTADVRPIGFPKDWEFVEGDQVAVDQSTGEAIPYVRTAVLQGHDCWIARNDDPSRERLIAAK